MIDGVSTFSPLPPGSEIGPDGKRLDNDSLRLKSACREFESLMVSNILKQGLNAARELGKDEGEEEDGGCAMFREMANEQIANFIGRQGILGVGDMMFNEVWKTRKSLAASPSEAAAPPRLGGPIPDSAAAACRR